MARPLETLFLAVEAEALQFQAEAAIHLKTAGLEESPR